MKRITSLALALTLPGAALAETFDRPIPQPQTEAAEFWFLIGSIALMIFAPMAAMLVQSAISRAREYEADRIGAEIMGKPMALASALEKIERTARRTVNDSAERNPATAHMFIINPLNGQRMDNLFSTHPDTANRIARLREMAGAAAPVQSGPWAPRGPWG